MSEVEGVVLATLSFLVFIIPAITYFVIISRPKRQEPLNSVQSRPIQPPLPQMKRNLSPNKNMRSVNSSSSHLPMSQRTIPDFGFFTNSKHSTPAASRLHLNEVGSNRLQTAASVTSSITRLFHQVPQVLISFSNLSYSVYDKKNVETKILDNISGFIKPYSLCAFMGPSGSGKTTLLDILAGRRNTGKILGTIQINGLRRNISTFKDISAYVMQDDLLFSYLTVRETLLFTADLKLASPTERITKVDKVISELNLTSLANTRIGNERIGGLTRGQKRRLTVAIELITSPSVLFLGKC